jgi:4,5-DOPA dioxygenase extradiol
VSAHWYVPGTHLTGNEAPGTIHDFGGFPRELYQVQYPAPGDVGLARRVAELLGPGRASLRTDWGIDHGTWSVLVHLRPQADWPVVQLSVHRGLPPGEHLAIGRALAPLRDAGVLVMASGNIVHNLRHALGSMGRGEAPTPEWATAFDADVARDCARLDGEAGRMSHPTPDHYLPLLYAAGAAGPGDTVSFPITGFDLGSLSMRAVLFS